MANKQKKVTRRVVPTAAPIASGGSNLFNCLNTTNEVACARFYLVLMQASLHNLRTEPMYENSILRIAEIKVKAALSWVWAAQERAHG